MCGIKRISGNTLQKEIVELKPPKLYVTCSKAGRKAPLALWWGQAQSALLWFESVTIGNL